MVAAMANVLLSGEYGVVDRTASILPRPQQLASLGTVLCLYRPQHGGELSGWAQAVRVESRAGVDSDGLRESLLFFDANNDCCWRLCLLPDSDFLAWDRLLAALPCSDMAQTNSGIAERLWKRLAGRLLGEQWHACVLQLHALPGNAARQFVLAASQAPISALGAVTARRIAQGEGAEENIRTDDCCCAKSASDARTAANKVSGSAEEAYPLIRLDSRK